MKQFDIDAYLRQAEREYSGANGSSWMYEMDQQSNFDSNTNLDLSFSGADAQVQDATPQKQASPYQVNVVNSTAGTLNAILFGANIYLLTTNFGSAAGVTVTPSQSNVTYFQLLQQSNQEPFETSLIRIQSSNTTQVTQIVNIVSSDANGQSCNIPIITQSYFSANQFQSTIVDIPYSVKIDGNTYLSFSVLANTTVLITMFPAQKSNLARQLGGNPALQQYAPPTVPVAAMPLYVRPQNMRLPNNMAAKRIG